MLNTAKAILDANKRTPVTIEGDATLLAAVKKMTEQRVGAVLIVGAGQKVTGIFTERDFARLVATHEGDALSMVVSAKMTRDVVTRGPNTQVSNLKTLMNRGHFRHVPIVDESEALIGMVSSGDVTKWERDDAREDAEAASELIRTA